MTILWLLIVLTVGPEADIRATVITSERVHADCIKERDRALKLDSTLGAFCLGVSSELYATLRGTTLRFGGK